MASRRCSTVPGFPPRCPDRSRRWLSIDRCRASAQSAISALAASARWTSPIVFLGVAVLIFASGVFDALDGEVARRTKRESPRGDLLDHVLDRYADIAILLGIADVFGKYQFPAVGGFVIYTVMVVILVLRPQGLFQRRSGR